MLATDSISPDVWAVVGPLLAGYGAIISFLIARDRSREAKLDALYEKMMSSVVPALERATAAAQGFPPILERNATAMASMVDATAKADAATARLLTEVAVLSDRQTRPPPKRT